MEGAFDSDEELRAAIHGRLRRPVADADWRVIIAELSERGSHPSYGIGDVEEAITILRSGIPQAVSKEANRLREMICGTDSPGLLSQLFRASARSALDQSFWLVTGRPTPDPDHLDEPEEVSFQRLLADRSLLAYPVLISLAAEILVTRHRISHHAAFCALFGAEPIPQATTTRSWPVDVIVTQGVAAATTGLDRAMATEPARLFRGAVKSIEREHPNATWLDKFEVYQSRWAAFVGRSFPNAEAFKKAAQRARPKQ